MAVSPNIVLGKYRILREIARSNDVVYEAVDPAMGRRVALKELQIPLHLNPAQKRERIERFYREAKAAGALSHPNIVTIHEVGQDGERHFIAMEYLEGQSLRAILNMQGALPLKETLEIAVQMCEALGYAHSRGVVHRDVKPDNISILPGGVVKLTDFGIARLAAEPSITSQGQVFGTPSYMSPEQVASRNVDHRTDLFSMGVTLYEMLTGRKPFQGDSVITITYNIMNIQPPMPIGVPPALYGILQRALAKDANLRYQSASAMGADLRAEKFALSAAPVAVKTEPMTFSPTETLDTGMTPPEISGHPAISNAPSLLPGSGANSPGLPTGYSLSAPHFGRTPSRASEGISQSLRSFLTLLFALAGLALLLAVIVWAVRTTMAASELQAQRTRSARLSRDASRSLSGGDFQAAARDFAAARQTAPTDSAEAKRATRGLSEAETRRGEQAARSNDPATAQAAFEHAVQVNAANAQAFNRLGDLRWSQRDAPGALQAWESALKADAGGPDGADARQKATQAYQFLAQQAFDGGNLPEARRNWQKIIEVNPGSDAAFTAQQRLDAAAGSPNLGGPAPGGAAPGGFGGGAGL